MAMADLSHARRVARRRARARASQQPSPVGVVGWRKQLRIAFVASTALPGHAHATPFNSRTEEHAGRAAIEC